MAQRQVPGGSFVNEVGTAQRQMPGGPFVNETVSVGGGATDLTAQDATHSHTADSPTLTTASTLAVQDATHAHTADSLTLTTSGAVSLTIADAAHAHAADSPTLTLGYVDLTIADALHGHTADSLTITVDGSVDLAIDGALHGHTADNIAIGGIAAIASGGGIYPTPRRKTRQEIDADRKRLGILPDEPAIQTGIVEVPKRPTITLAQLIGKPAADTHRADMERASAAHKLRKRRQDDDLLMMM